jgi:uncharacterized protein
MRRKDREIQDSGEIETILKEAPFGTLAFADGGEPYLAAMNYGLLRYGSGRLRLYFHSATEGLKLEVLKKNPLVCFQAVSGARIETAAEACGWTCRYRSVVARGKLNLVVDPDEKRRGLDALMLQYGWKGETRYPDAMLDRIEVLRLDVESITGKESG